MKFIPVSDKKNNTVFWGVTPCRQQKGTNIWRALLVRVKHPEDRGTRLLESISTFILDYMAPHPRKQNSS